MHVAPKVSATEGMRVRATPKVLHVRAREGEANTIGGKHVLVTAFKESIQNIDLGGFAPPRQKRFVCLSQQKYRIL